MAGNSCINIVQITDAHLHKEQDGNLLGMNTRRSLDIVLDLVKSRREQPDLILATGDLAQDGSAEAYESFARKMAGFTCPVIWFAGNHDDPDVMASASVRSGTFDKVWTDNDWKLIFLDSSVRRQVYGKLTSAELALLERELASGQDKHVAVCLHHQPVPVGCRWLDTIGLLNADELFAITDKYSNVRLILWGHIHQAFDQVRKGVRLLASPSTCVQFKPLSSEFAVDDLAPGYRWLKLVADGSIETGVVRAEHIEFNVDLTSKGY